MPTLLHASLAFVQAEDASGSTALPAAAAAAAKEPAAGAGGSGFMPGEWSTVASEIDTVYYFITWLSVFFLVLITALTVWFAVKYRRKSHVTETGGPTHHMPLELTWSIIPLLLVIAIFYVGMKGYVSLRTVPIDAYVVDVTAQKWTWTFAHPNGANETAILRVPAGRPVMLRMQSVDVLHALYIPAFRVKQDVVPGRITNLWFEAKEPPPGEDVIQLDLYCAEYCGTQHSTMLARVYVYTEEAFAPAIEEAARWIDRVPDEDLWFAAGPRIYARCASCHSLEEGKKLTGPSFRGLYDELANKASEHRFADGSVLSDLIADGTYSGVDDYLMQSILNPQKHVRETYPASMPTFRGQLKDRHIRAMIEFLRNLDQFDDKGTLKEQPSAGGAAG